MATLNENLECVICNENLADPRALPCGHSYCGPPRSCLSALKNDFGRMRCAVCRIDHNLKPDDIKPLYGIRDYIHENVRKKTKNVFLPCSVHENKECIFWCNTCGNMICDHCFDDEHDDHSVRKLKKHLLKKVEEKFGKSMLEGIVKYRENLQNLFKSDNSELEKRKWCVAEVEDEMEIVEKQIELLNNCFEFLNSGSECSGQENFLLVGLSNLDIKNRNLSKDFDSTTKTQECISDRIEFGTQTHEQHERESKSTQFVDDIITVTSSTQTELSGFPSTLVTVQNELLSTSQCIFGGARNPFLSVGSENKSSRLSSFSGSDLLKECRDELSDCFCMLEHKPGPQLNVSFILNARLCVRQWNPLDIRISDDLIVCPFEFWISVELVKHKFQRNEKILRFAINCGHADGKEYELLPASTFQYGIFLNNNKKKPDRKKEGSWMYPKYKQLDWYTVTYSEFMNPQNGWIDDDDNVLITLELKPIEHSFSVQ